MESRKFDPRKLAMLNDPQRLEYTNPDIIWKTLNLANPQVLVDIGAGTGFFAVRFAERIGEGKVYACDISDVMIEWMPPKSRLEIPRESHSKKDGGKFCPS